MMRQSVLQYLDDRGRWPLSVVWLYFLPAFCGLFEVHRHPQHWVLSAFIDGEETRPQDWITNQLESVICLEGESMSELYQAYAEAISRQHPPRPHLKDPAPMGWCSWYAYYAEVTEQDIKENVAILAERHPELEWVLLDDGYQAFMGDWLTPSQNSPVVLSK